jgi:hypothetical protein
MDIESVREDLGYMKYDLNKSDTYKGKADKIRIEYLSGLMKGRAVWVRRNIAEDLIKRGCAKEVI